ncbi:MAG TPA: tetratricopeptide repeat protein [Sphingobium sp.]|nr:tetratricopeptide repeat protein [Sphingobium sp.]
MTGIIIALVLALVTGAAVLLGARLKLRHAMPLAAALLFGLAGYAWQGSPAVPGKPVVAGAAAQVRFDERLAEKRREIGERISRATPFLVMSDSYASRGETRDAANILLPALRKYPDDPHLWVGLGNALMAHGNGMMSPAANYAFRQALAVQPGGISPSYFYGLALAESGDFEAARAIWLKLAVSLPEDAELRSELIRNIALLNALIRRRDGGPQPEMAP